MKLELRRPYSLTTANLILLAILLFTIFFVMLFPHTLQKNLYRICLSVILIAAFFCIDRKYRRYVLWPFIITTVLLWAFFLTGNFILNSVSKSASICLYITIAILLVKQAASAKTVTRIVLLESVNGYLMIAMFYSIIIALVVLFNPHAYNFRSLAGNTDEILVNFDEYLYYGFNAFTTVTYGDVIPVSPVAKSISMLLGFTGQMYVTIIIAMLVGKYAGRVRKNED